MRIRPIPLYEIGKSSTLLYGFKSLGIHPLDGIERYQASNGITELKSTDKIDEKDYIVLGQSEYPITSGWNIGISYKNTTLYTNFVAAFGAIKKHTTDYIRDHLDAQFTAEAGVVDKIWQRPGDDRKTFQSLFLGGSNDYYYNWSVPNTRTSSIASFIKLNNIKISYKLKAPHWIMKKQSTIIDIYGQIQNVKSWSNFRGADPETGTLRGTLQQIYSLGVHIKF